MKQPMREERGFFRIEGFRLEYRFLTPDQSSELTLVFLHEGLGCVAMWKDFPDQVARMTGCRVLIYSRAGYGNSTPAPLPRPLSFMHDEALEVLPRIIDAAGIDRCVLVGHSDGASIALITAGGLADRRVCGLILLAPHVFVEELTLANIRQAAIAFETSGLRERLIRYHGESVDDTFHGWCNVWLTPEFSHWNLEEFLPQIKAPVLLIQGEDDNYGTLLQLESIRNHLPQASEVSILPDCGHSPFRDRPEETLQAIDRFLTTYLWAQS